MVKKVRFWVGISWMSVVGLGFWTASCGTNQTDETTGSHEQGFSKKRFWVKIGDHDTFLKRKVSSSTRNASLRGKDYCGLYAGQVYQVYSQPQAADSNHLLINVVDFHEKGCSFSKGYVFAPDLESTSQSDVGGGSGSSHGVFPLTHRPLQDFTSGIRMFGALRDSGGRRHAGADLYSSVGRSVRAIASGRVLDYHYFYSGTYAVVVEHTLPSGERRIVRYGEVGALASGVRVGSSVTAGQSLAGVGQMECCHPMLHFEYFQGTVQGPLTTQSGPFQRRSDLLNPTQILQSLMQSL